MARCGEKTWFCVSGGAGLLRQPNYPDLFRIVLVIYVDNGPGAGLCDPEAILFRVVGAADPQIRPLFLKPENSHGNRPITRCHKRLIARAARTK